MLIFVFRHLSCSLNVIKMLTWGAGPYLTTAYNIEYKTVHSENSRNARIELCLMVYCLFMFQGVCCFITSNLIH